MVRLNHLKRTGKRPYRRIGRGQGSTRGKTSGKGGKGQTARAGAKIRPALRDIIKKLPKRRGHGKNRGRTHVPRPRPIAISTARLNTLFDAGSEISRATLASKGLIDGREPLKIVAGEAPKKFTLKDIPVSSSVRAAIEKAGGSVA